MGNEAQHLGRALLVLGIVITAMGALILLSGRIPWLGRLPGDIVVERKQVTFYFPVVTSILLSIVISIVLWFLGKR